MTPVLHESDEWKQLLGDIRCLKEGQHDLELKMTNLIGRDGDGGVLGTLVHTVGKLDVTVGAINETMIGWKAVLTDRKDRDEKDWRWRKVWYPIIASLLIGLLLLLASMWLTHSGREALLTGRTHAEVMARKQELSTIPTNIPSVE